MFFRERSQEVSFAENDNKAICSKKEPGAGEKTVFSKFSSWKEAYFGKGVDFGTTAIDGSSHCFSLTAACAGAGFGTRRMRSVQAQEENTEIRV